MPWSIRRYACLLWLRKLFVFCPLLVCCWRVAKHVSFVLCGIKARLNWRFLSNRPCKLLAIQIAAELPVVYNHSKNRQCKRAFRVRRKAKNSKFWKLHKISSLYIHLCGPLGMKRTNLSNLFTSILFSRRLVYPYQLRLIKSSVQLVRWRRPTPVLTGRASFPCPLKKVRVWARYFTHEIVVSVLLDKLSNLSV